MKRIHGLAAAVLALAVLGLLTVSDSVSVRSSVIAADNPADKKEVKGDEKKPEEKKPDEKPADKKPDEKPADKKPEEKKPEQPKPEEKPKEKPSIVAHFTLKGSYSEAPSPGGLFGELHESLPDFLGRLDKVSKDPKVGGVLLHFESPTLGRGKVEEIRQSIARVRAAGKKVYAYLPSAMPAEYLVAAACDEIIVPSSGTLVIPGVRAEVTFMKGLLDKLGIEADMLQMGKYKGAAEPMTRTGMSDSLREAFNALLDDEYAALIEEIAKARKLDAAKVKGLIDEGMLSAKHAKEAGLIDQVAYEDELREQLKAKLGVEKVNLDGDYGKKKLDTDFSGFGGMVKMMELMMGGKPSGKTSSKPKIAVVYAVGPISGGESEGSLFGESMVTAHSMVAALREADKDDTVKAIVLRVDSPGGSALASDLIWRETVRTKKPVIASMGDVAASGGYYISMGARKIYAEPSTLTGSIGVVGGKIALKGLYNKIGINTDVISRGKNSGLFSSNEKFNNDERAAWSKMMSETYHDFVEKAASGRKMDYAKLDGLAQGRIWSGRMAAKNGLVDAIGTLHDAINEAKQQAGLKDQEVELIKLPKPKTFIEVLFGDTAVRMNVDGGRVGASMNLPQIAGPEITAAAREIETLRNLLREPTLLWMPYRVEIK